MRYVVTGFAPARIEGGRAKGRQLNQSDLEHLLNAGN
jgi:hypothetical protein